MGTGSSSPTKSSAKPVTEQVSIVIADCKQLIRTCRKCQLDNKLPLPVIDNSDVFCQCKNKIATVGVCELCQRRFYQNIHSHHKRCKHCAYIVVCQGCNQQYVPQTEQRQCFCCQMTFNVPTQCPNCVVQNVPEIFCHICKWIPINRQHDQNMDRKLQITYQVIYETHSGYCSGPCDLVTNTVEKVRYFACPIELKDYQLGEIPFSHPALQSFKLDPKEIILESQSVCTQYCDCNNNTNYIIIEAKLMPKN